MEGSLSHCQLANQSVDPTCGCLEEEYWSPIGYMHLHILSDGVVLDAFLDTGDCDIHLTGPWPSRAAAYQALQTAFLCLPTQKETA